jgi:CMP-N-acetylneuraminic acid synthetase
MPICGKPLIHWTLDAAKGIDRVIVGTDSQEIRSSVIRYDDGVQVYDRKPVGDNDRMEDDLLSMAEELGFDDFMLLQCTSPMISRAAILGARAMYRTGEYDSIVSGVVQERRMWNQYTYHCDAMKSPLHILNGAIWVSSVRTINRYDSIVGGRCGFCPMDLDTYFEVDTKEEFDICELLLKRRLDEG